MLIQVPTGRRVIPVSRWSELAAHLEEEITSGRLQPGASLPSEAQLREKTGYSRTTIRRAYDELEGRGLVGAGPGMRRRVTSRMLLEIHVTRPASRVAGGQSATAGADSWEHDVAALGHEAEELLSVQKGPACRSPGGSASRRAAR